MTGESLRRPMQYGITRKGKHMPGIAQGAGEGARVWRLLQYPTGYKIG